MSSVTHALNALEVKRLSLQATVDDYSAGVDAGQDSLGKPLGKDVRPLLQPPFYATRLWPKVHHCMGGVRINEQAQVCLLQLACRTGAVNVGLRTLACTSACSRIGTRW